MPLQTLFDHAAAEGAYLGWQVAMLIVLTFGTGFAALARVPPSLKALTLLIPAAGIVAVSYQCYSAAKQQNAMRAAIADGVSEVTGIVSVEGGSATFRIGDTELIAAGPRFYFSASRDWLLRNIDGRCVRARYTRDRRVIWLAHSQCSST